MRKRKKNKEIIKFQCKMEEKNKNYKFILFVQRSMTTFYSFDNISALRFGCLYLYYMRNLFTFINTAFIYF